MDGWVSRWMGGWVDDSSLLNLLASSKNKKKKKKKKPHMHRFCRPLLSFPQRVREHTGWGLCRAVTIASHIPFSLAEMYLFTNMWVWRACLSSPSCKSILNTAQKCLNVWDKQLTLRTMSIAQSAEGTNASLSVNFNKSHYGFLCRGGETHPFFG